MDKKDINGYKWINSWISMNELLDIKNIAGYTREYLEWKKISLDIKRRNPEIFMLISIQDIL
jgi:hypothetical protein